MTFPSASFTAVAPPPDGLSLAFSAARRRRNSKAAVSAFGGAVAIASALSFLAPPGQTLVQEPLPPARGELLTAVHDESPRHGAPGPQLRAPEGHGSAAVGTTGAAPVSRSRTVQVSVVHRPVEVGDPCADGRSLACATLPQVVQGGPRGRAKVCPAAATVTVEYDAPPAVPGPLSASRTVDVGGGCRS